MLHICENNVLYESYNRRGSLYFLQVKFNGLNFNELYFVLLLKTFWCKSRASALPILSARYNQAGVPA